MEFIDYYRIVRERVWLPALMIVIAAAGVMLLRLWQPAPEAEAAGQLGVQPSAGEELRIDRGVVEVVTALRWEDVARLVRSAIQHPDMRRDVVMAQGLPPEAAQDFTLKAQVFPAERSIVVSAEALTPDTARNAVQKAMELVRDGWKLRLPDGQQETFRRVREAVQDREVQAIEGLRLARAALDAWRGQHHMSNPTVELQVLQSQLATLSGSQASSLLALEGAKARVNALNMMMGAGVAPEEAEEGTVEAALSPLPAALSPEAEELARATAELRQLLATKTPRHPRVVALRKRIEELREALPEGATGVPVGASTGAGPPGGGEVLRMRTAILDQELDIQALAPQIAWLKEQEDGKRTELQTVMDLQPEFVDLSRRVADADAAVEAARALSAQVDDYGSTRLDTMKSITIGSAAEVTPRRRGLMALAMRVAAASVLGGVLGVMLAFLLHYVDTSFRDEAYTEQALGHPVVGAIPVSDLPVPVVEAPAAEAD